MSFDTGMLDEAQRQVVEHTTGPLLVLAGPGSGKTRVVVHRVANLIHGGVAPWQIMALTFTNKAADEMSQRLKAIVGEHDVWVSTFHRFCARFLRRYASRVGLVENYSILDTQESRETLRSAIEFAEHTESRFTADAIYNYISRLKSSVVLPEEFEAPVGDPLGAVVADVYPIYQRELLLANSVDFDDLMLYTIQAIKENPELRSSLDQQYQHILVDEYQDTNHAQFTLMRLLSIDQRNVMATGDPDQSIYGWRGANIGNILNFETEYPDATTIRLERNYRSTQRILQTANALIVNNHQRKEKTLFTDNEYGSAVRNRIYPHDMDEANDIVNEIAHAVRSGKRKASDFAIFYRTNALSRLFESAFLKSGLPYQIVRGQEFFQRKEIRDLLAYLHLINNPAHNVALLRVINTPTRGIGKTTVGRLQAYAQDKGITLLEAAREAGLIQAITGKQSAAIAKFVALYDRFSLAATLPVDELLNIVVTETGYEDILRNSEDEDDQERVENIVELFSDAKEFVESKTSEDEAMLEAYLENRALVNETDKWAEGRDAVSMMTLHAAKGLEFPCVYIIAVEQGFLPHERNYKDPIKVEEERRLFFVGITRAKEELQVSSCVTRTHRGQKTPVVSSKFLMEIKEETETIGLPAYSEYIPPAKKREVNVESSGVKLMTGAQMLNGASAGSEDKAEETPPVPMEEFTEQMLVNHPTRGPGVILEIYGEGKRTMARVRFFNDPSAEKSFALAHSELRPVKK